MGSLYLLLPYKQLVSNPHHTDYPTVNQFGLEESQVPDWEEVNDTRFFVACFVEPVFNKDYPLF
jgi:hypothetical protein